MTSAVRLWRYELPGAIVVLGSDGFFSAVGDRGDYAHYWPSHGRNDFREFFIREGLAWDYILNKLSPKQEYDGVATLKAVKQAILDERLAGGRAERLGHDTRWTKDAARDEWDTVDWDIEDYEDSFDLWSAYTNLEDAYELKCCKYNSDAEHFVYDILSKLPPLLIQDLKENP